MNVSYLYDLILLFFIYSVAGWITEVTLKYFQYHRFINRGFLIGPYCPIYGTGAVIVTVLSGLLADYDASYGTSFVISFFFCGALEYLTGLLLEKRFHARWWDYSQKPMNLHGRVWIGNLILFGLGGMAVDKIFNPYLLIFLEGMHADTLRTLSLLIALIMFSDYLVSHFIIRLLKKGVESSDADDSEAIAREVRYLLENTSVLHKRILDAYPELVFRTEKVKQRLERARRERERLRAMANDSLLELSDLIEETRDNVSKNLVTTRALQRNIIDLQDDLIDLLLSDDLDDATKASLLAKLDDEKQLLDERERRRTSLIRSLRSENDRPRVDPGDINRPDNVR
ncbi:MAG: putative ABC transporter permease [Firmicutes bacterium]|nr:putative ABC transporter permease [Bacillota bacterium]